MLFSTDPNIYEVKHRSKKDARHGAYDARQQQQEDGQPNHGAYDIRFLYDPLKPAPAAVPKKEKSAAWANQSDAPKDSNTDADAKIGNRLQEVGTTTLKEEPPKKPGGEERFAAVSEDLVLPVARALSPEEVAKEEQEASAMVTQPFGLPMMLLGGACTLLLALVTVGVVVGTMFG